MFDGVLLFEVMVKKCKHGGIHFGHFWFRRLNQSSDMNAVSFKVWDGCEDINTEIQLDFGLD